MRSPPCVLFQPFNCFQSEADLEQSWTEVGFGPEELFFGAEFAEPQRRELQTPQQLTAWELFQVARGELGWSTKGWSLLGSWKLPLECQVQRSVEWVESERTLKVIGLRIF